ncbi:Metallo-dependent hydrolase [Hypoxylon trugodes]|uniref:Metallo-dependent hydrolase n=1 Tax=Hypoxylon trugodes TaxID=326681 RepID=UPI002198BE12|nr:Metallo-dependent hydrolase [Hypoxylon trugodes]KAI1385288.1 Metallo-dependent hydrolase [Hypoxylon trugodes]
MHKSANDPTRWDIIVEDGRVHQLRRSDHTVKEPSQLLLPALCHPHIHLDKAFILTCGSALYADLVPETGSFNEALLNTSKAKERYTEEDLYLRGSQLLATSYKQGVTSLRAFVEVDHVTGALPLTTAIRLKSDFSHLLEVQICAFAQDPLFSTTYGETNRSVLTSLLREHVPSVQVLGTTPYVEESQEASLQNIEWAVTTAIQYGLHLDFHLDYNLTLPSHSSQPLVLSVVELLQKHRWLELAGGSRTIVVGHCTQLTVLSDPELQRLSKTIIDSKLPMYFVGLPTSDMFMMGRPTSTASGTHARPRGTLQVLSMIKDLGLSACIGVNNVGNAFTPFGSGDPLQLASWGVGIYQAAAEIDTMTLYGCVSWLARRAIGLSAVDGDVTQGQSLLGMLIIKNNECIRLPDVDGTFGWEIPFKQRTSLRDIVWDPPEVGLRSIIRQTCLPDTKPKGDSQ